MPDTSECVAVITAVPAVTPVTTPLDETVATALFEDCQVADDVTFAVDPSP